MKEKRWRIRNVDQEKTDILLHALKIHPVLCSILEQREVETYEQAKQFLSP